MRVFEDFRYNPRFNLRFQRRSEVLGPQKLIGERASAKLSISAKCV